MNITYFALKTINIGGEVRHPGDLIPEAQEWPYLAGYLSDARIAPVLVATLPKATQEVLLAWEESVKKAKETTQLKLDEPEEIVLPDDFDPETADKRTKEYKHWFNNIKSEDHVIGTETEND